MASSRREYRLDKLTLQKGKTKMELLLDVEKLVKVTIGASEEPGNQ